MSKINYSSNLKMIDVNFTNLALFHPFQSINIFCLSNKSNTISLLYYNRSCITTKYSIYIQITS